jgi:hypothetical protein
MRRMIRRINCIVILVDSLDIVLEGVDFLKGELRTIGNLGKAQESMEHIVFSLVT